MKVTICFDDVKVIVPCGNGNNNNNNNNKQNDQQNDRLKVIDVIQNSIAKYKKATDKPNNCIINVLKLQTVRDGGILDPDDYIQEVVEDKELLVAIYQEYYTNTNVNMLDLNKQSNSLNNSSISSASSSSSSSSSSSCSASANVAPCNVAGTLTSATATAAAVASTTPYFVNVNNPHTSSKYQDCNNYLLKNHVIVTQQDFNTAKGYLKVKSGSESCIYKTNETTTTSRNRNDYINSVKLNSVNQQQANRPNSQQQHHHHHHHHQHNHQLGHHREHMGIMKTNTHLSKSPIIVDDALLIGTENTVNGVELTKSAGGYFSRVNSNRQSIVKNENLMWSNANSYTPVYTYNNNTTPVQTNNVNLSSASANNELFSIVLITNQQNQNSPLGIHVIPTFDSETQRPMGLVIQRIEPNGRIHKDGRLKAGDRIVEINKTSLIGVDFLKSQEILREAIKYSGMVDQGLLELKIVRSLATLSNMEQQQNQQQLLSSPTCSSSTTTNELSHNDSHSHDQQLTTENKENDENAQTANDESNEINDAYVNNNPLAINMSALNTKKIGKKITIQLIKGPQGLGFKLAARDNCAPGEFSPIYIKNILPKGAAITDGRLQRGDRLLEVNKLDMTQRTLHEAVNILRNTKLGSVVELIVSRQLLPHQTSNQTSTGINAAQLPREMNEHQSNGQGAEEGDEERQIIEPDEPAMNDPSPEQTKKKQATKKQSANNNNNRRQLLTFEIPLNETGSAGLGVSVKGKTKRLEENDCSIDLGIFIKTVINGGAASKDGRLRPNDQLININGFSLLGKSNEEAMLILREAMMVESKPGHIELTVSRKVKQTTLSKSNNTTDSTQTSNAANEEQRQVVKIIHHNSTSDNGKQPDEQEININNNNNNNNDDEDEEDTSVHVPITTSTSTSASTANSRFNRDAPNRRSMSEKRVKIGAVPAHFSQSITTSSGLNKFQQRINEKQQQHKQQLEPTVPKRSHTVNIIHTLNKQQIHHQQTQPQPQQPQRITIHKNYASMLRQPVELKIKNEFIVEPEPDHLNDDTDSLNRVGSFESLVNHRNSAEERNETRRRLYRSSSASTLCSDVISVQVRPLMGAANLATSETSNVDTGSSIGPTGDVDSDATLSEHVQSIRVSDREFTDVNRQQQPVAPKSRPESAPKNRNLFYMYYLKRVCLLVACRSKSGPQTLAEQNVAQNVTEKLRSSCSVSSSSSLSSLSSNERTNYLQPFTYDRLKPIEFIAEDFEDFNDYSLSSNDDDQMEHEHEPKKHAQRRRSDDLSEFGHLSSHSDSKRTSQNLRSCFFAKRNKLNEVEKTNGNQTNQTNYTLIKPVDVKHHSTGGYYSSRKSASMESIPQQNDLLNVRHPTTSAEPPNSNSDRTTANFNNNNHTNNNGHVVVNVHNKYGTIGGYSLNSNHKTNRPSILTNSSTNPTLNNTTSNSSNSNTINVNSNNNNNNNKNQVGTSTATSATNGIVPGSVEAMQSTSNSRLRAINRSFRTAVDKSFDVSNAANITAAANTTENADDNVNSNKSDELTRKADNKHAKSSSTSTNATSHKGLIGKFQNLFKSSAPAQTSSSKKQSVVVLASSKHEPNLATTTTANVSPAIDTSNQPSTANPNPKSTVELLNFQKKHFDSPNYNYDSNVQKLNPTLSANVTTHNQNVNQKAGKFDNQQILIENNTLYTQYRPQQQQQQVDVENGISTSSSSSSSVIPLNSSSSPSSSLSMTANRNDDLTRRTLTARAQFTSNRRESLFYHSSDNYRMVYNQQRQQYLYEQQQHLLKEQQRKFLEQQKKLNQLHEQQQQQQQQLVDQHSHQSRILSKTNNVNATSLTNRPYSAMSNKIEQLYSNSNVKSKTTNIQPVKQTPLHVMHSMPFNAGSNQVHSISDIFKDEPPGKTTPAGTYFDRLHVNQLSTKSQPPMSTYDYQKEILLRNHGHNQTESTSTVSSSSSTASTSSASSSISSVDNALTRPQFNFAQQQQQHQPFVRNVTNMTGKLTTVSTGRPVNKLNTNNVNYSSTVILPHPAQV